MSTGNDYGGFDRDGVFGCVTTFSFLASSDVQKLTACTRRTLIIGSWLNTILLMTESIQVSAGCLVWRYSLDAHHHH